MAQTAKDMHDMLRVRPLGERKSDAGTTWEFEAASSLEKMGNSAPIA